MNNNGLATATDLQTLIDGTTVGKADKIGKRSVRVIIDGELIQQDKIDIDANCDDFIGKVCAVSGVKYSRVCRDYRHALLKLAAARDQGETEYADFQPLSFGDFREQHPKLNPPVIEGICREGETVQINMPPKGAKSWMVMDIAMGIATGGRWLGTYQANQGRVLLIDNELHPGTLASRLERVRDARQYTSNAMESLEVISLRGRLLDLHRLGCWLDTLEPDTYKAIILDAWYRLIPVGTSENDNSAMMQLYNALDGHAARLGCAFIIVHHTSKGEQGGKAVTDVGSGAGAMSRCVDAHVVIRPHEDPTYSVLDAAVRSFPPMEPQTIYFEFPLWHPSDLEPKVATRTTAAQRASADNDRAALELVCTEYAKQTFTAYDVRKLIGCGHQKADRLVASWLSQKLLEKAGTALNQRKQEINQYQITRL